MAIPAPPPPDQQAEQRPRARERLWAAAIVAYFVVVAVDVVLRRDLGVVDARAFGSSPAGLAGGRVWNLVTSGLIVAGDAPWLQLAAAALIAVLVVRRHGARRWWAAALSAHLGSALAVYAVIALTLALDPGAVERILDTPDFGISCVLLGTLGALFTGALLRFHRDERARAERWLAIGSLACLLAVIPFSFSLYGLEHPLAFVLGCAVTAWLERRPQRFARAAGRIRS